MLRRLRFPLLVLLAASFGLANTAAAPPFTIDFADPFVLRDGATFYAFATGTRGLNVQLARSTDLLHWDLKGDALPLLPAWASTAPGFTWAPSVLSRGDQFVLYYTTRDRSLDYQCISHAIATRPEGPYVDESQEPFLCQPSLCGSIDPSPFVDARGDAYLYWKSDENDRRCNRPARLWGQRLTADALGLTGEAVSLLSMDRAWEHPLIEGPSMLAHGGTYHLFYSANWYESPSYAIGHATCTSPLGPCTKSSEAPAFTSTATELGPGGQEMFDDGHGTTFVAYHAWTAPRASYTLGGGAFVAHRTTGVRRRPAAHRSSARVS